MRLLLVDGTNLIMRYAHAMIPDGMAAAAEHPAVTSALPQIFRAVERAIRECAAQARCTHAIIALDSSLDSRRKQMYPEYKADRETSTRVWCNRLAIYCHEVGLFTARWPGEEADDVIATLATRIQAAGSTCAVLSGDGDLLQLASAGCDVIQFGRKGEPRYVVRDEAWIRHKYGIRSIGQLPMYKALVGDTSDNLPGVKGIGPKKAQQLLAAVPDATDQAIGALCEAVPAEEFSLMLSLVTLNYTLPLDPVAPMKCRLAVAS